MWLRPRQSTILILGFIAFITVLNFQALRFYEEHDWGRDNSADITQIPTVIKGLSFYSVKAGKPILSLKAQEMESLENDYSYFLRPNGVYEHIDPEQIMNYQAESAEYHSREQRLDLLRQALLKKKNSSYQADKISYFFKDKLVNAQGQVKVEALLEKTKDHLEIQSQRMKAWTDEKKIQFNDDVSGHLKPSQRGQPPIFFWANQLIGESELSQINLLENVRIKKEEVLLSSRKADFYTENRNKRLKYFVLNDDVKMTEKIRLKSGEVVERRAFGERMEGFSFDESIHLTGAPRVEQGKDVIKGNKIVLREKLEFIEIDDAMSDVETQKSKKAKP